MKKLGPSGIKWLKILHIIFVGIWFGGVISLAALSLRLDLASFDEVNTAYHSMRVIDTYIVRNGGQGILLLAIIYGIWTHWGFFRFKWVAVKWVTFIAQLAFGIFFLNRWSHANLALLETAKNAALSDPAFLQRHSLIRTGLTIQIVIMLLTVVISVLRPWKKKNISAI